MDLLTDPKDLTPDPERTRANLDHVGYLWESAIIIAGETPRLTGEVFAVTMLHLCRDQMLKRVEAYAKIQEALKALPPDAPEHDELGGDAVAAIADLCAYAKVGPMLEDIADIGASLWDEDDENRPDFESAKRA